MLDSLLELASALAELVSCERELGFEFCDAAREVALDGGVVAGDELKRNVRQLTELVRLRDREDGSATAGREVSDEPWGLLLCSRLAVAEELDELGREGVKIDQDTLIRLEHVKIVLGDVEVVEQEGIALVSQLHLEHSLVAWLRSAVGHLDGERRADVIVLVAPHHHRHHACVERLGQARALGRHERAHDSYILDGWATKNFFFAPRPMGR